MKTAHTRQRLTTYVTGPITEPPSEANSMLSMITAKQSSLMIHLSNAFVNEQAPRHTLSLVFKGCGASLMRPTDAIKLTYIKIRSIATYRSTLRQ